MDAQTILMWVGIIGLLITIIAGIVRIIQVLFNQAQQLLVAPLISQIATLGEKITGFAKSVDDFRTEMTLTRERIAKIEASAQSAHKRLDELNDEFHTHLNIDIKPK